MQSVLKENGDWDCPDVYCDECDHHRSVEWCSLAIPSHEEKIDDTYKMVNEAFFEGFDAAEKRYRFLIEYVEELENKSADAVEVVRCKDCKHKYVSGNGTTQYYVCDFMDAQYEDDGFCHHGESEVGESHDIRNMGYRSMRGNKSNTEHDADRNGEARHKSKK